MAEKIHSLTDHEDLNRIACKKVLLKVTQRLQKKYYKKSTVKETVPKKVQQKSIAEERVAKKVQQ